MSPSAVPPPGVFGHNRSLVTPHYAMMPPQGILPSRLPGFAGTVVRFQAAPALGARFAQALLEIASGGGTTAPRDDGLEHFFYVLAGRVAVTAGTQTRLLGPGGYAFVPPGTAYALRAEDDAAHVAWVKRPYEALPGIAPPAARFGDRAEVPRDTTNRPGRYIQFLLGTGDLAFDFEMNMMGFEPGSHFPCIETHIMEHGLLMVEGQGNYLLGRDWHEVWTGDFIWMGPFVPQQFYCTGWGPAAYLLYKNVNRDVMF